MRIYFFPIFILFKYILAEFNMKDYNKSDSIFSELPGTKLNSLSQIEMITKFSDFSYLLFFYFKNSNNSMTASAIYKRIAYKFHYIAEFLNFDCNDAPSTLETCNNQTIPKFVLLVPPERRIDPIKRIIFPHHQIFYNFTQITEELLEKFITNHLRSYVIPLSLQNIESFLNYESFNKIILFTERKKTSKIMTGLSSYFHDRILLGEVNKDSLQIINKFNIAKFPTLILYRTFNEYLIALPYPEIKVYDKEINIYYLKRFIESYCLPHKKWIKLIKGEDYSLKLKFMKNITLIKEVDELIRNNLNKSLVLYLNNNLNKIHNNVIRISEQINGLFDFVNIFCLNMSAFCKDIFKANKLPKLILLKPNTNFYEKLKKFVNLNYKELEFLLEDFVSEYKSQLKEVLNTTIATSSYESRQNGKLPVYYFFREEMMNLAFYLTASQKYYNDYYDFYYLNYPHRELLQELNNTKLPIVFILSQDLNSSEYIKLNLELNHFP